MTRPCIVTIATPNGKQKSLAKAKYPATIKDNLLTVEHAGGVYQVPVDSVVALDWGQEDPPDPNAQKPTAPSGKAV